jgi:predicted GNAT superfamily acetyltransferase
LGAAGTGRRSEPAADQVPEGDERLTELASISSGEEAAILALNNDHAVELSWLDGARLRHLLKEAFYARRAGHVAAFLLAFDQGADYDSPNYLWFRERYRRFVYVDRIVVAPAMRKRGLANRLYEDLFLVAREAGHDRVVCEVNSHPPNPASDAFHEALGFAEVGRAAIHGGAKTVRYLACSLTSVT